MPKAPTITIVAHPPALKLELRQLELRILRALADSPPNVVRNAPAVGALIGEKGWVHVADSLAVMAAAGLVEISTAREQRGPGKYRAMYRLARPIPPIFDAHDGEPWPSLDVLWADPQPEGDTP